MSKLSLSVEKESWSRGQAAAKEAAEVLPALRSDGPSRVDLQVLPTLAECEQVIERGRQTFIEVGNALAAIRDGRLYTATHRSFEAYCRERWGMSRTHADRQIAAARRAELAPMGAKPENERQARAIRDDEEEPAIEESPVSEWYELARVMDQIEALSSSDASYIAATVPARRRATTAKRLRKLGTYLGRIAWTLEGNEDQQ